MKNITYSSESSSKYEIKTVDKKDGVIVEKIEREEKKETFYSSVSLLNEDNIVQLHENKCKEINKKLLLASSAIGIGTGFAMMPIFNREVRELEQYGLNVHDIEALYVASTINTLIIMGISSALSTYKILTSDIKNDFTNIPKSKEIAVKTLAIGGSILPTTMLWNIELNNRNFDKSAGFDEFIAYATFCTIPLMIFKILESYESLCNTLFKRNNEVKLDTLGSKIVTYGTCILSAIARGVSYSVAATELCKKIGLDDTTSEVMGSIIGGILGSVSGAIMEYSHLKNLFKKQEKPFTIKEIIVGCLSAVEGVWFSLPVVSEGLSVTKDWNPLLKGVMFAPLLLSRSVMETSHLYKSTVLNENKINITI